MKMILMLAIVLILLALDFTLEADRFYEHVYL